MMTSGRTKIRQFLTAEEVPRWFGLSLVLIYLVGLGSVAHYGVVQARRENATHYQRSSQYAVKVLAAHLSSLPRGGASDPELIGACQRALGEFASNIAVRFLRVVDGERRVLASTETTEIGTTADVIDTDDTVVSLMEVGHVPVSGRGSPDLFLRARIGWPSAERPSSESAQAVLSTDGSRAGTPAGDESLFLEVRLPPEPFTGAGLADQARALAIVLVVLGALFVVYRCLREQLRGMSRIANRLKSHRDRLEDEIGSLRIADTLDGVTGSWNELVDLTQRLLRNVERSEASAELSRVLERSGGGALAEALSAIPEGIAYVTDEVHFEYLNSAACHFFGWTEEEAKSVTLSDVQRPGVAGEVLDLLRDALQPDGSFEARTAVVTSEGGDESDGNAYAVRISPSRRAQRDGECVLVIRDVSQNVRADRAREDFLTQVTHELRTPLTNIRAYAETLSSGMFDDPKVITECYNVITKETRRLSRLVEDVLSVSQLEIGTMEMQIDSVDLKTLLSDGVRDVGGFAEERKVDIQLVLPPKLEPIRGDRDKLAIVVNNLLGNAIKYTPPNGQVMVGCQFAREEVILTFKDNGIGIDPADHVRVFEKFQRASDPQVRNETGTGIGLYTAREIVRHHGGNIELLSEKGKGSTFLVRLPHQESRAAALTTATEGGGDRVANDTPRCEAS